MFSDFLNALPEDAETHVLAHSYGSLLAGKTLTEGARPDFVHVFGSPGIGVDTLQELDLEGETVVTVTSNPGDRVAAGAPNQTAKVSVSAGWMAATPYEAGSMSSPKINPLTPRTVSTSNQLSSGTFRKTDTFSPTTPMSTRAASRLGSARIFDVWMTL